VAAPRSSKIGIFDSGVGGLDVLNEVRRRLPSYDYVYLADNARMPYGDRDAEEIYRFVREAVDFLVEQGCSLIILACNTASSLALRRIQTEYLSARYPDGARVSRGVRVLGVLVPSAERAVELSSSGRVGVLATAHTVASGAFRRELLKVDPRVTVFESPSPRLAPLIESGDRGSAELRAALDEYLAPLSAADIDTLVLGCTHYAHIAELVRERAGDGVVVLTQGVIVAEKLEDYLLRHPEVGTVLLRNSTVILSATGRSDYLEDMWRVTSAVKPTAGADSY
jgi:glutamate racemase